MRPESDPRNLLKCDPVPAADLRNGLRIMMVSLLWAVVFVGSTWWLNADSGPTGFAAWAIAALCVVLGILALATFRKFLLDADELTRRIQLEGVAFGFGIGLLFSVSYQLFNVAGAPDMAMTHAGTVLVFGYIAGVLLATRRYS